MGSMREWEVGLKGDVLFGCEGLRRGEDGGRGKREGVGCRGGFGGWLETESLGV